MYKKGWPRSHYFRKKHKEVRSISQHTIMNTKSAHFYEPYVVDGQKYINLPTNQKLGVYEPTLEQQDFTVRDKSDYAEITHKLEKYGLCVIPNFMETSNCDNILREIESKFYRYDAWQGSPFPKETTVVTRSVLHSPSILKEIVCDRLFNDISDSFLNEKNFFMTGNVIRGCSSGIQLNSGIIYKVGPGAADQGYHREDHIHHTIHKARDTFKYGEETLLGLGVAFTDMNKDNGATRVIVGSHLWGPHDSCADFDKKLEFHVEANKGDAVLFWEAYTTLPVLITHLRTELPDIFFMSKGYLKQEENLHLGTDLEVFKGLSLEALKLLGMTTTEPYCGHIDYKSPAHLVNSELFENETQKGYYGETFKVKNCP